MTAILVLVTEHSGFDEYMLLLGCSSCITSLCCTGAAEPVRVQGPDRTGPGHGRVRARPRNSRPCAQVRATHHPVHTDTVLHEGSCLRFLLPVLLHEEGWKVNTWTVVPVAQMHQVAKQVCRGCLGLVLLSVCTLGSRHQRVCIPGPNCALHLLTMPLTLPCLLCPAASRRPFPSVRWRTR